MEKSFPLKNGWILTTPPLEDQDDEVDSNRCAEAEWVFIGRYKTPRFRLRFSYSPEYDGSLSMNASLEKITGTMISFTDDRYTVHYNTQIVPNAGLHLRNISNYLSQRGIQMPPTARKIWESLEARAVKFYDEEEEYTCPGELFDLIRESPLEIEVGKNGLQILSKTPTRIVSCWGPYNNLVTTKPIYTDDGKEVQEGVHLFKTSDVFPYLDKLGRVYIVRGLLRLINEPFGEREIEFIA